MNGAVHARFSLDALFDAILGGDSAAERAAKRSVAQHERMRTAAMLMLGLDDIDFESDSADSAPPASGRAQSTARSGWATAEEIAAELAVRDRLGPPLLAPRGTDPLAAAVDAPPSSTFLYLDVEIEHCNATMSGECVQTTVIIY